MCHFFTQMFQISTMLYSQLEIIQYSYSLKGELLKLTGTTTRKEVAMLNPKGFMISWGMWAIASLIAPQNLPPKSSKNLLL